MGTTSGIISFLTNIARKQITMIREGHYYGVNKYLNISFIN
jgi:hypothetical protein